MNVNESVSVNVPNVPRKEPCAQTPLKVKRVSFVYPIVQPFREGHCQTVQPARSELHDRTRVLVRFRRSEQPYNAALCYSEDYTRRPATWWARDEAFKRQSVSLRNCDSPRIAGDCQHFLLVGWTKIRANRYRVDKLCGANDHTRVVFLMKVPAQSSPVSEQPPGPSHTTSNTVVSDKA